MPEYDFSPCANTLCPSQRRKVTYFVVRCAMKNATSIGDTIYCPRCGIGKITRLPSLPFVVVRQGEGVTSTSNKFATNINGQETHISFVDHEHTDPQHEAAMVEAARRNGMTGAYYNEKHGKVCVDTRQAFEQLRGQLGRDFAQAPTTLPSKRGSRHKNIARRREWAICRTKVSSLFL